MHSSAEDKASSVKFCMAVYQRPRQGVSHFGELCYPRSPKSDESPVSPTPWLPSVHMCARQPWRRRRGHAHEPSACVDILPSLKMENVLVSAFCCTLCILVDTLYLLQVCCLAYMHLNMLFLYICHVIFVYFIFNKLWLFL